MKAEWKGRTFFAEVAEALGCETDQVLAAWRRDDHGVVCALYSVDREADPTIYERDLDRDADGVFVAMGEPKESGRFSEIVGKMPRG